MKTLSLLVILGFVVGAPARSLSARSDDVSATLTIAAVTEPKIALQTHADTSAAVTPKVSSVSLSGRLRVSSTAYCLRGSMANGQAVFDGAVAMNGVPLGTRVSVLSGPLAGRVLTVADRIGHSSQFDIWMSSCDAARNYGRKSIEIQLIG